MSHETSHETSLKAKYNVWDKLMQESTYKTIHSVNRNCEDYNEDKARCPLRGNRALSE